MKLFSINLLFLLAISTVNLAWSTVKAAALPVNSSLRLAERKGYIDFDIPVNCFLTNVYCLSVQTADNVWGGWLKKVGDFSWALDSNDAPWATFAYNGHFEGDFRLHCRHPNENDDVGVGFGVAHGWSYINTTSRNVRAKTTDRAKWMSAVSDKGAFATLTPWVNLQVYCL